MGPSLSEARRWPARPLCTFARRVLFREDVPSEDAALIADALVEANLRGIDGQGVARLLPEYVRLLAEGTVNSEPQVRMLQETASSAVVDADRGFGTVGASHALRIAMDKARVTGAAWVAVRNCYHLGAACVHATRALKRDMVGIVLGSSPAAVAPWGGMDRLLSSGPLAVAIPAGEEHPIVLDMATSTAGAGRVGIAAEDAAEIPDDWALDASGYPTTDPTEALRGALTAFGGHRGSGLAIVLELLTAGLAGAALSLEPRAGEDGLGCLVGVIDLASFTHPVRFKARVDEFVRAMHDSSPAPGFEEVRLPGERAAREREIRAREGIPIPDRMADRLAELGRGRRVPFPRPLPRHPA